MSVTIRTLAEKLNLSITTVSRALDGYTDVSEETRKRVIQAAHEMGYEPSYAARQLRRKRSDAIGYILPSHSPQFSDPVYVNFITGLCDEAASQKLDLVVTSSPPESEQEREEYRRWAQGRRVDGVIINRTRLRDWRIEYLVENQIPFVSLGKSESADNPCVIVDERGGFRELVAHMVEKGHRQIAFIGGTPNLVIHHERLGGYQEGLQAAGLDYDESLVLPGNLTEQAGYEGAVELLARAKAKRPTAILGCNDLTALGAMRAAKEKGLYIGTELAVAGFHGIQEAEYTSPPLTTLVQPTYDIARMLTRMLVQMVNGKPLEEKVVYIQPELIIRASTG